MKKIYLILLFLSLMRFALLPAQTISHVNESGNLIVEGEAFLPLGFYSEYIFVPNYPSLIPDMVAGGFNTLVTATHVIDTATYQNFLASCNSAGLKNIIVLPHFSDEPIRFHNYIEALKPNPSVIMWNLLYNADDYDLEFLQMQKQQLLERDQSRVVTADFNRIEPPFQYMLDVLETSCISQSPWAYPWNPPVDLETVTYRYRFHALKAKEKGVFPMIIPQAFNWEENNWPSPEHLDCQTYLGYITGNKGVLFYTFPDAETGTTINISHPELYAAASNIAIEILQSEWKEVILHGEYSYHNIFKYKHYATWRYNNSLYLIAANASHDQTYSYEIPLPADVIGEAENFFDHRPNSLNIQNGMLTGDLEPYQIAIYKMEMQPTGINILPSQLQIQAAPNPTNGIFSLTGTKGIVHCKIYNAMGQCVFQKSGNLENEPLNIGCLNRGVYYIEVEGLNKSYQTLKIVKK